MDKILELINACDVDSLSIDELIIFDEKLEQLKRYIAIVQSNITKQYKLLKIQEMI